MGQIDYDITFVGAGLATLVAVNDILDGGYTGSIAIIDKGSFTDRREHDNSLCGYGGRAYQTGFDAIDWKYAEWCGKNIEYTENRVHHLYWQALKRLCQADSTWDGTRKTLGVDECTIKAMCTKLEASLMENENAKLTLFPNREVTDLYYLDEEDDDGTKTDRYGLVLELSGSDSQEYLFTGKVVLATDIHSPIIQKTIKRFDLPVWIDGHTYDEDPVGENWVRANMPMTYGDYSTRRRGLYMIGDGSCTYDDLVERVETGMRFAQTFLKGEGK